MKFLIDRVTYKLLNSKAQIFFFTIFRINFWSLGTHNAQNWKCLNVLRTIYGWNAFPTRFSFIGLYTSPIENRNVFASFFQRFQERCKVLKKRCFFYEKFVWANILASVFSTENRISHTTPMAKTAVLYIKSECNGHFLEYFP
jgi:hypothetical protein